MGFWNFNQGFRPSNSSISLPREVIARSQENTEAYFDRLDQLCTDSIANMVDGGEPIPELIEIIQEAMNGKTNDYLARMLAYKAYGNDSKYDQILSILIDEITSEVNKEVEKKQAKQLDFDVANSWVEQQHFLESLD